MKAKRRMPTASPCLCNALRQASRAVSRLCDEELRGIGLRATQYSLLQLLRRSCEVRQWDPAELALRDETPLTRSLRPLGRRPDWGRPPREMVYAHRRRGGEA
jgi:hypothetical protein